LRGAGVFFFDGYQLQLLAEGMSLLPYVESVMILERRSGTDSVILSTDTGVAGAQHGDTREYPLLYEYDGTEREIGTLQAIVRAVDNRILAIALVHQKLYHGGNLSRIDMKEYLEQLAQEIRLSQHRPNLQIELQTDIEELSMLIDTAIPCGMVLCELLSNSVQHAFPKGRSGMIRVALSRTSDELYLLTVAADGIGVGSSFDPRRDGALGIQSVTAIVETQLRGQGERLRHSRHSRAALT